MAIRVLLVLAAVVVAGVLAVVTLVVAVRLMPAAKPTPAWTAASGKPVPGDFRVLCYPSGEGSAAVALYDREGGSPVPGATLQRALANTVDEMKGAWAGMNTAQGVKLWVRTADLRYERPTGSAIDYDGALAAQKTGAGYRRVKVERVRGADGVVTVRLSWMLDDEHVEEYVSTVANGTATPVEMQRYFGPAEAMKSVPLFLGAAMAAGAVGFVVLVAGVLVAVRVTRKKAAVQ